MQKVVESGAARILRHYVTVQITAKPARGIAVVDGSQKVPIS
jgi:hypothetical protein